MKELLIVTDKHIKNMKSKTIHIDRRMGMSNWGLKLLRDYIIECNKVASERDVLIEGDYD